MHPRQAIRLLVGSTCGLSLIGLVYIASAASYWSSIHYPDQVPFYLKQLVYLVLGIGVFLWIQKQKISATLIPALYIVGVVGLLTVWIPGLGVVRNGARGWISLAGIHFQPAELAKLSTLLFVAKLAAEKRSLLLQVLIVGVPGTLFMLQPDFGSTFLLLAGFGCLLYVGGISYRLLGVAAVLGALSFVALIMSAPYRLQRITAFLDPWKDPLGTGFQAIQSLLAIGPAGWMGWGFSESRQKLLYLPEPQNDFIFALIVEESGFFLGMLICVLYTVWGYAGFFLASTLRPSFYGFGIVGLVSVLLIQAFVNLGVVTGVLPVTGVTLPFISYGGTSLVICWILTALIIALYRSGKEAEEWKN